MKSALILLVLVAASLGADAPPKLPPQMRSFIQENFGPGQPAPEEVGFTLIDKNEKFETRRYPAWSWVCLDTTPGGKGIVDFIEVTYYLQGANSAGEKMGLTVPVIEQRREGGGGSLCSPLPAAHQTLPPAPTSIRLRLVRIPETDVLVRRFPGWPRTPQEWIAQGLQLRQHVEEAGLKAGDGLISAVFSPPNKAEDRRNEAWLIKV